MFLHNSIYSQLFPYMPQQAVNDGRTPPFVGEDDNPYNPANSGQPTPAALAPVADENGNSLPVNGPVVQQPDLTGFDPSSMGPSVWTGVNPEAVADRSATPTGDQPALTMPATAAPDDDAAGWNDAKADDAKYLKKHPPMPDYSSLPPEERSYREAAWNSMHGENQDHGLKGNLKQILSNFLYSMGEAYKSNPMISPGALLAVGGVGAGAGQLQPAWNERRMAAAQVPVLKSVADAAAQERMRQSQANWYQARPGIEASKVQGTNDRNLRTNLTRMYNSAVEFHDDDAHPDDKAMADQYEQSFGFRPPDKDAKTKSVQFGDEKTGEQYLLQTDAAGHQKVVKLLNDDGTPLAITDKSMLTSEDRSKQRDLQKLIADNHNITSVKVADINAASRKYATDTSAATSRYSTDARTQLGMISDVNKLNQTRTTILSMTPNKGENADAFKQRQQAALAAVDARIGELKPK